MLGLLIVVVVVVDATLIYFAIVPLVAQGDAQVAAVRQFCADEVQQDYAAAYALLSTTYIGLHGDVSES